MHIVTFFNPIISPANVGGLSTSPQIPDLATQFIHPGDCYVENGDNSSSGGPVSKIALVVRKRAADETIIPATLRARFAAVETEFIVQVEERIARVSKVETGKVQTEKIITGMLQRWAKDRLIDFAYGRYVKYMLDLGLDKQALISRQNFAQRSLHPRTVYREFRHIERLQLRPGVAVVRDPNNQTYLKNKTVYIIKKIHPYASITLEGETCTRDASGFTRADEKE